MSEQQIIKLWKSGLSKNKIAEIFKREYNQQIRLIRSSVRHRHDGKYITNYDALRKVELTIYQFLKKQN